MASSLDWKTLGLGVVAGLAAAGTLMAGYRLVRGESTQQKYHLRKSFLDTDPRSEYVNSHNTENAVLSQLRSVTLKHARGRMTSGLDVGKLLTVLTKSLGARKVIDVGMFTGCSAYSMALGLPEGGKVVACDVVEEYTSIGKPFWAEGGVAGKIDLRIQPATKTLQDLIDNGEAGTFDLIFIDADKENYVQYYEMSIKLLRQGGVVVVDNALWQGKVADRSNVDTSTVCIRELNTRMKTDTRVSFVLLDVSDGLGIVCKQ